MKYVLSILAILLTLSCVAQTTIPSEMKKAVAFIFIRAENGKIVPNGTGFYVSVVKDSTHGASYVVTAKHVIKKPDGSLIDTIFIRVFRKADSQLVTIPINIVNSGINKNLFTASDTTVDIAVIGETPRQDLFDYLVIPESFITTRQEFESLHISEGTEVFFTGMFSQYLGEKANYPITRFGRVSLVTNEKVFWNGCYRDLYLLETTTYWGNSGSPVYFALQRKPKPVPNAIVFGTETYFKLAGIMNGFFGQNVPGGFSETKLVPYEIVNFGIAAVTPAYLLRDILFSDEARKNRGF